jgi:hypothetical protein
MGGRGTACVHWEERNVLRASQAEVKVAWIGIGAV